MRGLGTKLRGCLLLAAFVACGGEEFTSGESDGGTTSATSASTSASTSSMTSSTSGSMSSSSSGPSGSGGAVDTVTATVGTVGGGGGSAGSGPASGGSSGSGGGTAGTGGKAGSGGSNPTIDASSNDARDSATDRADAPRDVAQEPVPMCMPGTKCGPNLTKFCNQNGQCVDCLAPTDCPGTPEVCTTKKCDNGVCSTAPSPAAEFCNGFADQCDGLGHCVDCVNSGGCDECCVCSAMHVCIPASK